MKVASSSGLVRLEQLVHLYSPIITIIMVVKMIASNCIISHPTYPNISKYLHNFISCPGVRQMLGLVWLGIRYFIKNVGLRML